MVKAPFPFPGPLLLAALVAAVTAASAHLEPGSLSSPEAGRSYPAGGRIDITWIQQEFHSGRYGLYYSLDAGGTWELIASWAGPAGDNVTVRYGWTLPDTSSRRARVRVCQIGNCREEEYFLESGDFSIGAGSPILRGGAAAPASLRYLPDTRILEVSFSLGRRGKVLLQAFDARGRLLATLLDGEHAPGAHRYALPSPRPAGAARFRLAVDGAPVREARGGGP